VLLSKPHEYSCWLDHTASYTDFKKEMWDQMVAPFFECSFGLLAPHGQLGFIVANAFAKREFGGPLVESFLALPDTSLEVL
jgi:hypothetical protein